MEDERPSVNIGKMALSGAGEQGGEKGPIADLLERIEVRPRTSRMRWVLRGGQSVEIMDVYHRGDHRPVRMVESEFDYSGLEHKMRPSGLLNYTLILEHMTDRATDCKIDSTFNLIGYTLNELPKEDSVKNELEAMYGASDSLNKIYDNRAFFNDHSARIYLHYLREKSRNKT